MFIKSNLKYQDSQPFLIIFHDQDQIRLSEDPQNPESEKYTQNNFELIIKRRSYSKSVISVSSSHEGSITDGRMK